MSRSRKKPYFTDYSKNYTKWAKRQANKVVRKFKFGLSNGKGFKKLYCSYNIKDWIWYSPNNPDAYRK